MPTINTWSIIAGMVGPPGLCNPKRCLELFFRVPDTFLECGPYGEGAENMRRLLLIGLLLLAGCQNVSGPFACKRPERVDDPRLPLEEQERRGRDRLALPENSPNLAPRSDFSLPWQHGLR